ncbi:MAG TPA: HNH endonuclease [Acidobacteriaceae bacterium]|nr:HNH endonuclease [Acidobacteriaceae bacterium]
MPTDRYGERWSRDELVLALYLYCQIPFSKTKANNPEVIKLAALTGRTPASVARKLGNFGAFDPLLERQGISGLLHGSRADKLVWDEFYNRWAGLVAESSRLLVKFSAPIPSPADVQAAVVSEDEGVISRPTGPSERSSIVSVRLFQSFFRRAVLASYDSTCCVCGLDIRSLLVASHIKPWSIDESARSNPENGLCLCAIHDRAFDRGLIAVSEEFRFVVASKIIPWKQHFVRAALVDFHDQSLRRPKRFLPSMDFLRWHRQNIFVSNAPK